MRGNDVTKSTSKTPTVEMENIDVPASPQDNLSRISEVNITDNRVRRQRAKTKDSVMPGIRLNNSIVEATRRLERKAMTKLQEMLKQLLCPKSM